MGVLVMGFADSITSGFNKYVTFSGRAARSEYWYWTLFTIIASVVAGIIDEIIFIGIDIVGTLVSLGLLLPSVAVGVRRLHDIERSGWWLLIGLTGIGLVLLIYWDCVKGTTGPNRFGPDPLGTV
jgi:uncharacterized membrane protein YhaH (DUF805 family)